MSLIRAVEAGSAVIADGDEVPVAETVPAAGGTVGSAEVVVDGPDPLLQAVRASVRAVATAAILGLDMVFLRIGREGRWWAGSGGLRRPGAVEDPTRRPVCGVLRRRSRRS